MLDVGRLMIKIAGRDAGKYCVIVEKIDSMFVLIDGQVRRRKCNIKHLEPLDKVIKIKKGASHAEIVKEFKKLKLAVEETKKRTKKTERPKKQRKKKEKPQPKEEKKTEKKEEKKVEKKKETKKK